MKSIIIYFSQTGNTMKVAKAIRDSIKAATRQCDIVKMKDANIDDLSSYDLLVIGCPTFAFAEPLNVSQFIRGLGTLRGKPCFIFSTHGGHPGNVLTSMAGKLRRQGLKVIGGFNCDAVDHMPHFTDPWFTAGHPDDIDLKAAADFGREMVELSRKLLQNERIVLPKFQRLGHYRELQKLTKSNRPLSRGFNFKMTVDREKCRYPRCHICVDNCPVNAIDLSVDPIVFRKGCISCHFCEMVCPSRAIEFDPGSIELQRPIKVAARIRSKYPEFFERAKAELLDNRSTLYRMLVDKVEIGNITTMYGEPYLKRPRYVIRDR